MGTTLLLADDSFTIQKVVGIIFANEDCELVVVDNGVAALEKAREMRPDAMLVDAIMPGMNGYEVCEEIRRDPALRDVPILLMVGAFESFDEERAKKSGADDHITKPFESQSLIDKVREMLEIGRSRASAKAAPSFEEPHHAAASALDIPLPAAAVPETEGAPAAAQAANLYDSFRGFVHLGAESPQQRAGEGAPEEFTFESVEAPAQPEETTVGTVEALAPPPVEPGDFIFLSSVDIVEASPEDDLWGTFGEEIAEGEKIQFGEVMAGEEMEPSDVLEEEIPPVEFGAAVTEEPAPETETASPAAFSEIISLGMEPEPTGEPAEPETAAAQVSFEEPPAPGTFSPEAEERPFAAEEAYIPASEAFTAAEDVPGPPADTIAEPASVPGGEAALSLTEEQLAAAVSRVSREVIERIAWDVVPDLAEAIIKEEIRKIKEGMMR